ncbi:hypothetical protein Tfu_1262 [Thermobifida fusca YX]|uniref:HTH tetR-type domain-containing protein n=1 Tax=Thermobifida fusca (strain YX) TaxID=269800 RepID=Q47QG9_THEFY|nr:hypothetical protein Tfu_1262 [Thermobifida fusca YX]
MTRRYEGKIVKEAESHALTEEFLIRPPRQERSRRAWARVLEAGASLFEEGGYEAFTIAAVCERAKVAPRAIYDRTPSKDALLVAVYEYWVNRVWEEMRIFDDEEQWIGLDGPELVTRLFTELGSILRRHESFTRSLMALSPTTHDRIYRRVQWYNRQLIDRLTNLLLLAKPQITHSDPETAVQMCLIAVYSALIVHVGCGAVLAPASLDRDDFNRHLAEMALRYLLGAEPQAA